MSNFNVGPEINLKRMGATMLAPVIAALALGSAVKACNDSEDRANSMTQNVVWENPFSVQCPPIADLGRLQCSAAKLTAPEVAMPPVPMPHLGDRTWFQ